MKDGYWINYKTGKEFPIHEHEQWIREPKNAKKLGVPAKVVNGFSKFKPQTHREKLLLFVMKNAPVMRVRGHGNYATFEYASRNRRDPMDAIFMWGQKNAGDFTGLNIVNFATKEEVNIMYGEFERLMDIGPDEVMRAASVQDIVIKDSVVRELLALSKEILG